MLGGANWGGAAFDPETGHPLRAVADDAEPCSVFPSRRRGDDPATDGPAVSWRPPARTPFVDGLPLFKPPYTRVTAIDMNTGEHLWIAAARQRAAQPPAAEGSQPAAARRRQDGISALVTKTLLFVTTWRRQRATDARWCRPGRRGATLTPAARCSTCSTSSRARCSASSTWTGQRGAADDLPARGKQYLVMAVGANEDAAVVAFGLPGTQRK